MSDLDCCYPFIYGTGRESLCGSPSGEIPPDSDFDWVDGWTIDESVYFFRDRAGVGGAAIARDGSLWCWGKGPLGDGTLNSSSVPVKIGTDKWKKITRTDDGRWFGIKEDGTLWGWGDAERDETTPQALDDEDALVEEI